MADAKISALTAASAAAGANEIPINEAGTTKKLTVTQIADFIATDERIMQYGLARQAIMNGNFDVWQRGTSVALADVTQTYQADRWSEYVDKNGGTLPTLTRSRQLLTSGDIQGAKYFTRLATNGAGTSLGVSSLGLYSQRIENATSKLCGAGKKVTLSFYAKSDIANKRIGVSMIQSYGTGGSPTADEKIITQAPITLTSSWVKYTVTFTTNTLVGKTFGTNGDDYIQLSLWTMWGTTYGNINVYPSVTAETFVGSGNIDIAQVQLCSGDVALPFQPKSYEEELRACKRYYQVVSFLGVASSVSSFAAGTPYPVEMRKAPTSKIFNSNAAGTGTDNAINRYGVGDISFTGSAYVDTYAAGFGGAGQTSALVSGDKYVGSLKLDAEL